MVRSGIGVEASRLMHNFCGLLRFSHWCSDRGQFFGMHELLAVVCVVVIAGVSRGLRKVVLCGIGNLSYSGKEAV